VSNDHSSRGLYLIKKNNTLQLHCDRPTEPTRTWFSRSNNARVSVPFCAFVSVQRNRNGIAAAAGKTIAFLKRTRRNKRQIILFRRRVRYTCILYGRTTSSLRRASKLNFLIRLNCRCGRPVLLPGGTITLVINVYSLWRRFGRPWDPAHAAT